MAELKTIITLRQGTTADWADSDIVLKKGEMGLEYLENGHVKIKAGDNEHIWSELSYIDDNVNEANVFQVELSADDTDDIEAIEAQVIAENATKQNGDVAIVKTVFAGDKVSYTSYVYDEALAEGASKGWSAMDGNYSASNVFFKDNITLAGDYTSVGNVKLSEETLSTAGRSLEDVMTSIFTKELNTGLKTADPTASITSATEYIEVGSSMSKSVTVSLNEDGSYQYGYATAPENLSEGDVATSIVNNGSTGVVVDTSKEAPYSVTFNGATQTGANGTFTLNTPVKTTKTELTASGKVYYTQGGVPVSNLKKAYPAQRIAAGQATSGASTKFRWYIPYYKGFIYNTALDTVDVSKLLKITGSTAYSPSNPKGDTATGSWRQYWLVAPKSYNWTMNDAKDSNNLTLSVDTKDDITITYGSGDNKVNVVYSVFVITHAADYDTKKISWS